MSDNMCRMACDVREMYHYIVVMNRGAYSAIAAKLARELRFQSVFSSSFQATNMTWWSDHVLTPSIP
jgi:hypothetical protein